MLCVLPLFHINALFYSFAGALVSGATIIFERRFGASRFWETVAKTRASQVNLIAAAGNICSVETDLSSSLRTRFQKYTSLPLPLHSMLVSS